MVFYLPNRHMKPVKFYQLQLVSVPSWCPGIHKVDVFSRAVNDNHVHIVVNEHFLKVTEFLLDILGLNNSLMLVLTMVYLSLSKLYIRLHNEIDTVIF